MMSLSSPAGARSNTRYPFTASQWQELEHQALIFKYMVSGMPIPPDLLFTIKRSMDPNKLILHQPQHMGWNCFQMGFGRKIDPEPGRCRRTDGKKWRCSKEAYTDSKYCERHMHRGRNRSRKPVETTTMSSATNSRDISLPTAIPISSRNNSNSPYNVTQTNSTSVASYGTNPLHNTSIYAHSPFSRSSGIGLDSGLYSHTNKDFRNSSYGHGMREDIDEHPFFSESSGTVRSMSGSSVGDSSWHLEPLTVGGSAFRQKPCSASQNGYSYLQLTSKEKQDDQQYYLLNDESSLKMERDDEPQKVMHHFFDEWPKTKESWLETDDKLSNHAQVSTTQLSISMPSSAHHNFFMSNNDK
ncbi:growth-regulating factor 1 [Daucus carota subsp. sativus]|nr:PREDICTED: growth-regulating factor 1 [Daucus carota subsp. sativus]